MPDATPTSVYRYYDGNGFLLYVGITSRGALRNREHNNSKPWWQYVDRQEVEHHPTRRSAEVRESALIRKHAPPFNRQQNADHKKAAESYLATVTLRSFGREATGRQRIPGVPITTVGDRVTMAVADDRLSFDPKSLVISSGGRRARFCDHGKFSDGSGTWFRIATKDAERCAGSLVMFRGLTCATPLSVKLIELVFSDASNAGARVE